MLKPFAYWRVFSSSEQMKMGVSSRMGLVLTCASIGISCAVASGASLEIRFHPAVLRTYEVDPTHKLAGALLQNAVVLNGSEEEVRVDRVELELLAGTNVLQVHHLDATELERAAKRGFGLQQAGLLQKYSFQFRPETLLGKEVKLSATPKLLPHAAILLGQRYFAFAGTPDRLRLRATGIRLKDQSPIEVASAIPIQSTGSSLEYLFPIAGRSFIATGQGLHQPHRWVVAEEFALDIVRLGENGSTHKGDGSKRTDFFAYGAEVRAVGDGTVVSAQDEIPESDATLRQSGESLNDFLPRLMRAQDELITKDPVLAAGNYIILQHATNEFSLYAHLVPGSIQVKKGSSVKTGQVIGRLGHSGNSSEPHLHFQIMDSADPLMSSGIPIRFKNISLPLADGPRFIQSGDIVEADSVP